MTDHLGVRRLDNLEESLTLMPEEAEEPVLTVRAVGI